MAFRYAEGENTTVSRVSEEGEFVCYFLEDSIRDNGEKVHGETCIPTGRYRVGITHNSPMSMRYYARWPDSWYAGLPTLTWDHPEGRPMDPYFSALRIHPGSGHSDTLGCPLTATDVEMVDGDYRAVGSVRAFERLCHRIYEVLDAGEECYLTISDHEIRL
jgi:hypothetical protein